jgi:hypothetical protein
MACFFPQDGKSYQTCPHSPRHRSSCTELHLFHCLLDQRHCCFYMCKADQGLLVISHATNGKPTNGTFRGSNSKFPKYKSGGQTGLDPLGQSWDPWKKSGKALESGRLGKDTFYSDHTAELEEFSNREINPSKYGVQGNEGEEPYRILENGQKAYLDELDVLTLLDPPAFIRPMDSRTYNHATFLW